MPLCYCPLCSRASKYSDISRRQKARHKKTYGDAVDSPLSVELLAEFGSGASSAHPDSSSDSDEPNRPTSSESSEDAHKRIDTTMASISLDESPGDSGDLDQPAFDESAHDGIDTTMASISLLRLS